MTGATTKALPNLDFPRGVDRFRNFWSVVSYDPQTLSELPASQAFPSKNNRCDP